MGLPQPNIPEYEMRSFYYTGTTALLEGQPLCYQESPAAASVTKTFGYDVEVPNATNALVFAGVVPDFEAGVVGPTWIELIVPRPGDLLQVLVGNTTNVAVGDPLSLNFDIPTAAGTERGAFELIAETTTLASAPASDASAILAAKAMRCLFFDSVSLASATAAGERAGNLRWVRFI